MDFLFPLLILALLVPMFLGVRRQKKEAAKTMEMQDSLSVGDRILTTAGLHATIVGLTDDTVDLEIAAGVVTTWSRLVIRERLVTDADLADADDDADDLHDTADDRGSDVSDSGTEIRESAEESQTRLSKD